VYWLGDGADVINEAGDGAAGGDDTIEIRFSDAIYTGTFDLDQNLDVTVVGDSMTLDFQFSDGAGSLIPMGSITIDGMGDADTAVENLTIVNGDFSYNFDLTSIYDAASDGIPLSNMSFADAASDAGQLSDYHTALDDFYGPDLDTVGTDTEAASMAAATFDGFETSTDDTGNSGDDATLGTVHKK
jgi:hypothetical protein